MAFLAAAVVLAVVLSSCSSGPTHTAATTSSSTTAPEPDGSTTAVPTGVAPTGASEWLTYHGDNQRSGVEGPAIDLAGAQQAWTSPVLDGQIYAEPLIWGHMVIAATANDTVYALSSATGKIAWSRHLGSPVPLADLPCGDVDPLGILGTPAIDPVTGHLFVAAETLGGRGAIGHELFALDPSTGRLLFSESDGPKSMNGPDQQQRPALLVIADEVYTFYGGLYGDCGTYGGWVVGAPTAGPGSLISYRVDAPNQAAIWAPAGGAVDTGGDIVVATGNGQSTSVYNYGDSVIKLSPTLQLVDSFAPQQWPYFNSHDLDLGSTSPALVDGGRYVFEVGKQSIGYLLDEQHLGGIGGQVYEAPVCSAIGGDAVSGDDVFVSCSSGVKDVRVNPATEPASFSVAWSAEGGAVDPPILAGGLLWAVGGSTLFGLNPSTGAVTQRLALGRRAAKFATPAVGDGILVVGAGDTVRAFAGSGSGAG